MNLSASRAILRISRRNVGRSKWRSVLVVLLVMLPVTAMVGATTWLMTTTPAPEVAATRQLGQADMLVYAARPGASLADLASQLPTGSEIEAISSMEATLLLPGRTVRTQARALDLDGLARGMLTLIGGRLPAVADEVAISRSMATVAGVGIGDAIEIDGWGRATVVGFIEDPSMLSGRLVLQHPSLAGQLAQATDGEVWLVRLPSAWAGGTPPLDDGFSAQSRSDVSGFSSTPSTGLLVLGALAMIETILVAAAAFAVSIRRRQRELGILAAAGAQPHHLVGTVVGEGLWLGGLGALLGAVTGFLAIVAVSPWIDQLSDHRNPMVSLDVSATLAAIGIGLVAALIAAAIPAWTAARLPVLTALSGRRPPAASARRLLGLGVALVALAALCTAAGAALRLGGEPSSLGIPLLIGGAILGVLGFGAASPWLIERLERLGLWLPFAGRVALRDAARARSRTAPIVTAMLASLAVTISLSAYISSNNASTDGQWRPWLRPDQLVLRGFGASAEGPQVAQQMGAIAGAALPGLVPIDGSEKQLAVMYMPNGGVPPLELGAPGDNCLPCTSGELTTGDRQLLVALGAESAAEAFAAGSVVVLTEKPTELPRAALVLYEVVGGRGSTTVRATVVELPPAIAVPVEFGPLLSGVIVPPTILASFGFKPEPSLNGYVIRLAHPVTEADVAQAAALVAHRSDVRAEGSFRPLDPNEIARVVIAVLSLLFALTVTAIAVALAETESRPDQRTLLAIGADPGVRRRIAAARAGVLALLAGVLAVPAGLLPVWGLLASRDSPLVVPLPEVLAVLAVLPLAAMAGALILSRPIPAWSAFRDSTTA